MELSVGYLRKVFPSLLTVYALFLGLGLGVLYAEGELSWLAQPQSEAHALWVGFASLITAIVVMIAAVINELWESD